MARAGACSRRDAETWIGDGRVAVNGEVLRDPAFNVGESDTITIDGTPLPRRARTRLFRFHKPRGLVTTDRDPEGRRTIFDHLREHWADGPRVVSVGRLDINTEGLILLTNDGGLARVLELPATGWVRRYRVRANGTTDQATLDRLRDGVTIDGVAYSGIEATFDRVQGANCWLTISLREGKNREVKRVLEHLGLVVNRLIRISFGPFQLGELAEGAVDEVRTKVLRDQLGPSLAKAAGADFASPIQDAPEAASPPVEVPRRPPSRTFAQDHRPSQGPRPRQTGRAAKSRAPEAPAAAKTKPPARVRKHVSVLRKQETGVLSGPRKRIERGETADRSGRIVSVERVVAAVATPSKEKARTRNGRRLAALREERDGGEGRRDRGTTSKRPTASARPRTAGDRRASDELGRTSKGKPRRSEQRGAEQTAKAGAPGTKNARPRAGHHGSDKSQTTSQRQEFSRGSNPKAMQGRRPARGGGHGKGGHEPRPPRAAR